MVAITAESTKAVTLIRSKVQESDTIIAENETIIADRDSSINALTGRLRDSEIERGRERERDRERERESEIEREAIIARLEKDIVQREGASIPP